MKIFKPEIPAAAFDLLDRIKKNPDAPAITFDDVQNDVIAILNRIHNSKTEGEEGFKALLYARALATLMVIADDGKVQEAYYCLLKKFPELKYH